MGMEIYYGVKRRSVPVSDFTQRRKAAKKIPTLRRCESLRLCVKSKELILCKGKINGEDAAFPQDALCFYIPIMSFHHGLYIT